MLNRTLLVLNLLFLVACCEDVPLPEPAPNDCPSLVDVCQNPDPRIVEVLDQSMIEECNTTAAADVHEYCFVIKSACRAECATASLPITESSYAGCWDSESIPVKRVCFGAAASPEAPSELGLNRYAWWDDLASSIPTATGEYEVARPGDIILYSFPGPNQSRCMSVLTRPGELFTSPYSDQFGAECGAQASTFVLRWSFVRR